MAKVIVKKKDKKSISLNKENVKLFIMDYIEILIDSGVTDRWIISRLLQEFFSKDELRDLGFLKYAVETVHCAECNQHFPFEDFIFDDILKVAICPYCGSIGSCLDTYM